MQKKILIPIIVIIFLLGALAGVMMLDDNSAGDISQGSDASSDANGIQEIKGSIGGINPDAVTAVEVRLNGEKFGFIHDGERWAFASNPLVSVSSGAVDSLINSLVSIEYTESYSQTEMKLSDCGISNSSDAIDVSMGGSLLTISRGINTTDGKLCYMASSEDDNVYLVPRETAEKLFAPLESYRNSAMLNLDFDNITEISISNANENILLKKEKANTNDAVYNEWKLLAPIEVSAGDEYVKTKLIEPLKQIKISGYASDNGDFASFGLGTRDKFISLKDANGKIGKLYFSSQTGGKYYIAVNDEPTVYEIALSNAPYIDIKAINIADRNINLAKMTRIKNVTIDGADKDYNIEFFDASGKVNGKEVAYDILNQKIFPSVCGLFADDIYNGTHGNTELTIEYNYKDNSSDRLEFSSYNDRMYSVSKNGKVMYLILKTKIADLGTVLDQYK